jgi:hypothetical protein
VLAAGDLLNVEVRSPAWSADGAAGWSGNDPTPAVHAGLASDEDALRDSADVPTSRTSTSTLLGGKVTDPGHSCDPGGAPCTLVSEAWLDGGRQREWLASAARSLAGPGRRVVAT